MTRSIIHWLCVAAALVLAGCATKPKIEAGSFPTPRTVVIADIPNIVPVATIGAVYPFWPGTFFAGTFDFLFAIDNAAPPLPGVEKYNRVTDQMIIDQIIFSPQPISVGTGAAMAGVGGLVGALIQSSAEETQKKSVEFPGLVLKAVPDFNLRRDFMDALRQSLEAHRIEVKFLTDTRNQVPRLYWPAWNEKGQALITGPFAQSAAMDTDLLVQVVPIAAYVAPGPLNNYVRRVGVALALFEGRTRKFVGWQAFPFDAPDSNFQYARYDSLASDVANAGPALHSALMSLVPDVASAVAGKRAVAAGTTAPRNAVSAPAVATQAPATAPVPSATPANSASQASKGSQAIAVPPSLPPAVPQVSKTTSSSPATSVSAPAPVASPGSAKPLPTQAVPDKKAARLQWLQQMRDANLISASEYETKRQQVLSAP